ncbi:structural maintenance of chromosomes protein 6 isoform X2 [Zootermopsis nevadensis]|uniref:Structural maintenance of chromosomes protein 6 n=2 Tax=Zootermopsis nevadensis TaxID=136037 RepID=A0A067QST9_ZOONE|nr:structural maintenance of chromosomes protein 6 isoform X2 [Zootermopsis nevadensis]XP_021932089.1 structural maintenance of chromosomes protein 6 isoform X2 [Zootermopsis nevadensis]KDR12930.1 Structural maintenance of chromosomes protein 6 [Zootermopsis nevadensis]
MNVSGALREQKRESENSGKPGKRMQESDDVQSISKKLRRDADISFSGCTSNEPKCGIIERIYMRNFMCHSSMEICLNPRINFVVGRNGSGKSAILTALIVGLGGKASSTNRGASLKEFIKKGSNTATIEITLRNTGHYNYKREEYGDRIIVLRSISNSTAQCYYRVKTGQGEVISSKKEELDRIVSAFNIQIENPVTIMNQDTARTFLNSSNSHEKYNLFMKATQLEQIKQTYAESMLDKRTATALLNSRKEAIIVAENKVTELQLKWKKVQSLGNYRKKSLELENELYWAVAVSEEKAADKLEQEIESRRAEYSDLQRGVTKESEQEQMLHLHSKKVDQQISEMKHRFAECEAEYKGSREEVKRTKENYTQKERECKTLELKILRIEANINVLRQEIEKVEENSGGDRVARQQKNRLEIQELEKKLADVAVTLKTNKHHYSQLNSNLEKIKSEEFSLRQELQEQTRKIEQKQTELQALKREKDNSVTLFGAWVPRVSQKIDEAFKQRKFGKMPKGPVGAYIKLKDASWAPALESFLGSFLRSYCVDSARDAQVLMQIFNDVLGKERKPAIITSRFFDKVHNVSKFAVKADGYSSILDSVVVQDTVVCNCLIDQWEVENILLIPTSREACDTMSDARRVPLNCKRAVTKKGDLFYPDPNYRMYSGNGSTRAKYFQVSMADAISTAEEDLKAFHFQKKVVEKQFTAIRKQLKANYDEFNVAGSSVRKMSNEEHSLQLKLTKLKDMDEPNLNSIDTLTAELEEYETQYADKCKQRDTLEAECQLLKDEMDKADLKSSQIRDTIKDMQTEECPLLAKRETMLSDLREILSKKKFQEEKCNEFHKKILQLQTQLHSQQERAKKAVNDAAKICPRIDTERIPVVVEKELNECKKYMESVEEHTGKHEEICVSYHERKTKYEQIVEDMKNLEQGLTYLEDMIKIRENTFNTIRRLIGLRVQHMFQSLLYRRRYTGAIVIDHQKQTLNVKVSPSKECRSVGDTMTLSGGERSYATVSFIMALWDAIDPPFYFLDEFDVFMDKVNRRVTMDLLLQHSRLKTNYQFVFLTPQDTYTIQSDEDVTIHRLQDPCRGNNTQ